MAQEHAAKSRPENSGDVHVPAPAQDVELGILNGTDGTTEKAPLKKSESVPAGEEDESGKVYPPTRQVMVVMLSLYLSLFLVSLVSFPIPYSLHHSILSRHMLTSLTSIGSNNYRHSSSCNH
jgi:hypothetical protein